MDALITAISFVLAYYIKFYILNDGPGIGVLPVQEYYKLLPFIVPGYMFLYYRCSVYSPKRTVRRRHEIYSILQANTIGLAALIIILYMIIREINFSRSVMAIFYVLNVFLTSVSRIIMRKALRTLRKRGYNLKHILLVGYSRAAEEYIDRILSNPQWGYVVCGILDEHIPGGTTYKGVKVLGTLGNLEYILPENKLDEIAITLSLKDYDYLEGLESFQEGLFAVQDISSMFVGELAAPKVGDQVIDVCAAPGGKSLHVAEKLQLADEAAARENGTEEKVGRVEARDLTEYKTDLIWQNIDRSGLGNICAVCKDASVFDKYDEEAADLVIADLPCSGLGVLGKKPDLKYRVQPEDLEELADLQRKILTCAQAIVKEGGTLLYSTCTVNPGENIENVHWFLKEYPQFELDDITENICKELKSDVIEKGCIQFFPGVHDCDGFFIARFKKKA